MKSYTVIISKGREDQCIELQEELFKVGFNWGVGEQEIQFVRARSLTLNQAGSCGQITYSYDVYIPDGSEFITVFDCLNLIKHGKLEGMTPPVVEVTMDEIAEWKGIDVDRLKVMK